MAREEPNPFTHKGVLPYHLQSFWIAVRREMFLSEEWAPYWRELPAMHGVLRRGADARGDVHRALRRRSASRMTSRSRYGDYDTKNPSLLNADALLDDGCPVLKRRPFFQWPPYLDRLRGDRPLDAREGGGVRVPDGADLAEPRAERAAEGPERGRRDARGAPRRRCLATTRTDRSASSSSRTSSMRT